MYRDDGLIALVRRLPCCVPGCGAAAPSEPMHSNQLRHGKGKQIKSHDSALAAGCKACHRAIDQGSTMSYEERISMFNAASVETMRLLLLRGWLVVNPNA